MIGENTYLFPSFHIRVRWTIKAAQATGTMDLVFTVLMLVFIPVSAVDFSCEFSLASTVGFALKTIISSASILFHITYLLQVILFMQLSPFLCIHTFLEGDCYFYFIIIHNQISISEYPPITIIDSICDLVNAGHKNIFFSES